MATFKELSKPDYQNTERPVPEILPTNYLKNEHGIFKIIYSEDKKTGEVERINVPLTYTPFEITQKFENPDTNETSFEISFNGKAVTISGADISNKKGIVQLAGYGLNTVEKKAHELCVYIMEYRNLNHIPKTLVYDRMGWKDDGGFVLGQYKYTATGKEKITISGTNKQIEAVHSKGDIKGWVHAISGLMKYEPQRFKMYLSTLAPLLKIIDEDNICTNDMGDTSVGKTITDQASMSIYAHPHDITHSSQTTQTGMERTVTLFNDLPVLLDDVQTIEKDELKKIVYMLSNGTGKTRGAKNGGLQELFKWRTVGKFTSEDTILKDSSFGGLSMRLIEVRKGLGEKSQQTRDIIKEYDENIKDNYGTFGSLIIEYIIKHQDDIRKEHQKSKKTIDNITGKYVFNNDAVGIAGRLANTFAAILTAGKVFENLYSSVGGDMRDPEIIVSKYFETALKEKSSETYAVRGLNHILSWITANGSNFLDNGVRSGTEERDYRYKIYGSITGTHYLILPNELRTELERAKFSFERLISDFYDLGYLDTDPGRKQKKHRIERTSQWVYSFIRERVDLKEEKRKK